MSTDIHIRELSLERRADRAAFVALPFDLARGYPQWQPGVRQYHADLLHPRRNPFWRDRRASFFVAVRGARVVGRVGVVDPGSIRDRDKAAVLAMPDFVDDAVVVDALVRAAADRARERGAAELIGPMNPNIHHDVGVQVSGFETRNAVFMGWQPPHYATHLERAGFRAITEFEAWSLHSEYFLRDGRMRELVERVERKPALRVRTVNLKRFDPELRLFHRLYAESFAGHWGFVPPTWDEFRFIASDMRFILNERMALVAEWSGEPVGFVVGIPDLYEIFPRPGSGRLTPAFVLRTALRWRRIKEVRVMIAGVLPAFQQYGVHVPLFYRMACNIFDLGYRGGEISWVMRDNRAMQKALPLLGARRRKSYRLYEMAL